MSRQNVALDAALAHRPLGSSCPGAYALTLGTETASITLPAGGRYRCWLKERTAGTSVFCKIGGAATVPADATVDASVFGFPGDTTVTILLNTGETALHAIATAGTPTLYLVRLD